MNTTGTLRLLAKEIAAQGARSVQGFTYAVQVHDPFGGSGKSWDDHEPDPPDVLDCEFREQAEVIQGGIHVQDVQDFETRCRTLLRQGLLQRQPVIIWNTSLCLAPHVPNNA